MSTTDPYGKTDRLDETSLEVIVARLEARGKHPFFDRMLREYLDAMDCGSCRFLGVLGWCSVWCRHDNRYSWNVGDPWSRGPLTTPSEWRTNTRPHC